MLPRLPGPTNARHVQPGHCILLHALSCSRRRPCPPCWQHVTRPHNNQAAETMERRPRQRRHDDGGKPHAARRRIERCRGAWSLAVRDKPTHGRTPARQSPGTARPARPCGQPTAAHVHAGRRANPPPARCSRPFSRRPWLSCVMNCTCGLACPPQAWPKYPAGKWTRPNSRPVHPLRSRRLAGPAQQRQTSRRDRRIKKKERKKKPA